MVGNGGVAPWCNSSKAPGIPASGRYSKASATLMGGIRSAKALPGRRKTRRATWRRRQSLGDGEGADAGAGLKLLVLDELNIALRYDYLPLDEVVETLKARRPDLQYRRDGTERKARADRGGGPRHRDDAGEAPFRPRGEGARGHRVLMAARAIMLQGTGSSVGKSLLVAGLARALG